MDSFNEYFDKLEEALTNPVPVTWQKSDDSWLGQFCISETQYDISITRPRPDYDHYAFKFQGNGNYVMLNNIPTALRSIPTIDAAATEFLHDVMPEALFFFATDQSESRKMMYDRFCDKIVKSGVYQKQSRKTLGIQVYTLFKDTCDMVELQKTISEFLTQWFNRTPDSL